ncbi:MAG: hypothetical protein ACYDDO_09505 [Acidiferrobacterales bacterium]
MNTAVALSGERVVLPGRGVGNPALLHGERRFLFLPGGLDACRFPHTEPEIHEHT